MSWLPSRASISERFYANFEQINIPPRPVVNRGRFSNMSGLSYLTCVKLNWPISNLLSESERKYWNCPRTIAGSRPLAHPLAIRKQKPIWRACLQAKRLFEGTETVPCRLSLWMAWMELDWNLKNSPFFQVLILQVFKNPQEVYYG